MPTAIVLQMHTTPAGIGEPTGMLIVSQMQTCSVDRYVSELATQSQTHVAPGGVFEPQGSVNVRGPIWRYWRIAVPFLIVAGS